jgi:glycosyltransferase involved in cell wall biosynthesis
VPEPVRVLLLVDSYGPFGGAERLVVHLAHGFDRSRVEPTVCVTRQADPAALDAARSAGIRVIELRRSKRFSLREWQPLWRELRNGIDVLHAHKFGSNVWGSMIGRFAGVPVIAHEHTWSFEGETGRKLLDRWVVARLARLFIAVSEEDARRMTSIEHIEARMIEVVPNGIPPLPEPAGDVRAELGIPADAFVVGAVTVFRPQKALEVMIGAAAQAAESVPGLHVLLAGDGPDRARVEAQVQSLGLAGRVHIPGARRDVSDVLAALDVFALSSDFEGSPLAVIEAMSAGKPIVATRVGGVPDLLAGGRAGVLVPPRDEAALARAIVDLAGDAGLRERLGAAARERQRAELTLASTVERITMLYERVSGVYAAGRHLRPIDPTPKNPRNRNSSSATGP